MAADDYANGYSTRLLSCYLEAADDGLNTDAIMLCEVVGEEIQTISLRVAADPMMRLVRRSNTRME